MTIDISSFTLCLFASALFGVAVTVAAMLLSTFYRDNREMRRIMAQPLQVQVRHEWYPNQQQPKATTHLKPEEQNILNRNRDGRRVSNAQTWPPLPHTNPRISAQERR